MINSNPSFQVRRVRYPSEFSAPFTVPRGVDGVSIGQGSYSQTPDFKKLSPDDQKSELRKEQIRHLFERQADLKKQLSEVEASAPRFDPFLQDTDGDLEKAADCNRKIGILAHGIQEVETALYAAIDAFDFEVKSQADAPILANLANLVNRASEAQQKAFDYYVHIASELGKSLPPLAQDIKSAFDEYNTAQAAFEAEALQHIQPQDAPKLLEQLAATGADVRGVRDGCVCLTTPPTVFSTGSPRTDFEEKFGRVGNAYSASIMDALLGDFKGQIQGK